jgi:hypothetical protein
VPKDTHAIKSTIDYTQTLCYCQKHLARTDSSHLGTSDADHHLWAMQLTTVCRPFLSRRISSDPVFDQHLNYLAVYVLYTDIYKKKLPSAVLPEASVVFFFTITITIIITISIGGGSGHFQ